jgi:hypothetical protein
VIGKVLRGQRVDGLIYYLYGPGRANEHMNPHIVAGWDHPAALEPPQRPDGSRDFHRLNGLLHDPVVALNAAGYDSGYKEPVWHCVARAAPEDEILSDDNWAEVAHEVMNRTGLAPHGDDEAVRWIAVRHADDHIHIVAMLARQDGTKPNIWNDYYRVREACREIEDRFGLRITAAGDRTAARRPTRAESEQVRRRRWEEAPRIALRRHVVTAAASAGSEQEFFTALEASGVQVRKRFSEHSPGEVDGYAVALKHHTSRTGELVWYGGRKLAADLTLPKLRRRWGQPETSAVEEATASERPSTNGPVRDQRAVLRVAARNAAATVEGEKEFFARLETAGVLVRLRFNEVNPSEVTGYAVSLPDHFDVRGNRIWYGGGRLADDLTLPKLRRHWGGVRAKAGEHCHDGRPVLAVEERAAIWDHATTAANTAAERIRALSKTDPDAAADAAWATSDTLHVAASALDSPELRRAADAYDRAARQPYGRIPSPTPTGDRLRVAARLLALTGSADHRRLKSVKLVAGLAGLATAVADLRGIQRHAAQGAGARAAAECLLGTTRGSGGTGPAWDSTRQASDSVSDLARGDFPTTGFDRPKPGAGGVGNRYSPGPRQRPEPPRRIGPRR